jgi:hypothetical protein
MIDKHATRVEHECNLGWATTNPDLMVKSLVEFQTNHPIAEWRHHIDLSHVGYVTLIAHRRTQAYDASRDFLKEIGMKP